MIFSKTPPSSRNLSKKHSTTSTRAAMSYNASDSSGKRSITTTRDISDFLKWELATMPCKFYDFLEK
jgi:hypothetical protein